MNRTSFIVKVEIECMYILKVCFFSKEKFPYLSTCYSWHREKTSLISNNYNATCTCKCFSDLTNVYRVKHGVYKKRGFKMSFKLFLAFRLY